MAKRGGIRPKDEVVAKLPKPRGALAAVLAGDGIYALGGFDGERCPRAEKGRRTFTRGCYLISQCLVSTALV